jgi:alpha-glucosidase
MRLGLDIEDLVRYGNEHSVKVMLYVDRRHLDQILPAYKSWDVKAIKFGFVNTGPQRWTRWLVEAARKCAGYGILLNIHDAYRPFAHLPEPADPGGYPG